MELITLEKQAKGTQFIYTAKVNGQVIYESAPTHREYIAMGIMVAEFENGGVKHYPGHRWGRIDLIGGGDSKTYLERHLYKYVAVLDEVKKFVHIPEKALTYKYTLKHRSTEVIRIAESEAEAKRSFRTALKRYKRLHGVTLDTIRVLKVEPHNH